MQGRLRARRRLHERERARDPRQRGPHRRRGVPHGRRRDRLHARRGRRERRLPPLARRRRRHRPRRSRHLHQHVAAHQGRGQRARADDHLHLLQRRQDRAAGVCAGAGRHFHGQVSGCCGVAVVSCSGIRACILLCHTHRRCPASGECATACWLQLAEACGPG